MVNTDFYVPKEVQSGLSGISELPSGDLNPIDMLYSDSNLPEYPSTTDANDNNAYNITFSSMNLYDYGWKEVTESMKTFKILLPGALEQT